MSSLGPDAYFATALDLLSEGGPEALTIAGLCSALRITKGSFYHHFGGMPAFVDALLAFWEEEHSNRLIALSKTETDPVHRAQVLVQIAMDLPHGAEAAFRAWGRSNPVVAAAQTRVDAEREDALTDAVVALGLSRKQARLHARMAVAILLGVQIRSRPVDVKELAAMYERLNRPVLEALQASL